MFCFDDDTSATTAVFRITVRLFDDRDRASVLEATSVLVSRPFLGPERPARRPLACFAFISPVFLALDGSWPDRGGPPSVFRPPTDPVLFSARDFVRRVLPAADVWFAVAVGRASFLAVPFGDDESLTHANRIIHHGLSADGKTTVFPGTHRPRRGPDVSR